MCTPEQYARAIAALAGNFNELEKSLLEALELYLKWCEAESNHGNTTFYERIEMCLTAEYAARAAVACLRQGLHG